MAHPFSLRRVLGIVALAAGLAASTAQAGVVLLVDGSGVLTGATGVSVGSNLYDVQFTDGSCDGLFNSCTTTAFAFHSSSAATAASQALLDQVLLDGAQGHFDTVPGLTQGCVSSASPCVVITPYGLTSIVINGLPTLAATTEFAENYSASGDTVAGGFAYEHYFDTAQAANGGGFTWAVWSPSAPSTVPEPQTLALVGVGFAALWGSRRRAGR